MCAGSGASTLQAVQSDMYLTGEMSHHNVLDAVCKGTHVILCDHSNTERGFLHTVRQQLSERFCNDVQILVSSVDRDPLVVV